MKKIIVLSLICIALSAAQSELPLAESCDAEACQLPDCRCSSTTIPGGLAARDTPQFVMLTFDDAVTISNIDTYRDLIYDRINKNRCPVGATFYVSHEWTNYHLVNELYNRGLEIALHSITHQTPQEYWLNADYETMVLEFADQRRQMAHFANIPMNTLKGVRIPFLQMTGNSSFHMMADYDIEYDCTWPSIQFVNPGMWPYTLDYASTQDCVIPPCPTASIPGPWVLPMITWRDINDNACSMVDGCLGVPNTEDEWFEFILENFERHYTGNRAPFGFFIHEWYLIVNPHVRRALVRFLDLINNLNDVFMVNSHEVIDWVKDPVPLDEYVQRPCRPFIPTFCSPTTCALTSEHNDNTYWMTICTDCPPNYPWIGNPLGQ